SPAELLDHPDGQRTRLGGTVEPGSLRSDGGQLRFRLGGGGRAVTVRTEGLLPASFREGQDAVVEGVLTADGTFRADQVLVRHGNEYRPTEVAR
ncbi:cytochrome c maturation protein CcmE, partial [Micromonospora zhanjiangensis]